MNYKIILHEALASYLNVSIFVIVICSFFISLWVFHNSNKSKLLTLIKNSFVQLF